MRHARTVPPIRTAIVGFGVSGRVFHAPLLAASRDYSLGAIVTADADRAAAAAHLHPHAAVLASIDDLLMRANEFDLVVLGSPPVTHAELAMAAMNAGLDVVVDKPFTVTSDTGRALVAHAASTDRRLTVFQNRRWDGDYLTVRRLIRAGCLGDVARFESRFETFKPSPRQSWKSRAGVGAGGGVLFDLGAHLIDQALCLFGPADEVYAELFVRRAGAPAEDDAFLALRHRSGQISHLWMNTMAPLSGPRFRVLGSTGAYTTWGLDGQEAALTAGMSPHDPDYGVTAEEHWGIAGAEGTPTPIPPERGDYGAFYRALARAILEGEPVPVDPADAVEALELIERAHKSAQQRPERKHR